MILSHKPTSSAALLFHLFSLTTVRLTVLIPSNILVLSFLLIQLTWSLHIRFVCSKAHKSLPSYSVSHASTSTLLKLYKSLVLPHLSYCFFVYDPPSHSLDAALLEKTQCFTFNNFLSRLEGRLSCPIVPF